MRLALACSVGLVAVFGTACSPSNIFQCQANDQCTLEGSEGVCQDNGYCSFQDPNCASGVRYADSAPPGLAGMCVEVSTETGGETTGCVGANCVGTSSTSLDTTGSSGGSSSIGTSVTTEAVSVTAPSVTSELTTMVDPDTTSSTTDDPTSSGPETGSSSGSGPGTTTSTTSTTTTTTDDPICPEVLDEFDNGVANEAPWIVWDTDPGDILEFNGHLQFEVFANTPGFSSIAMTNVDMVDGYAVAHLTELPQANAAQFFFRISDPSRSPRAEIVLAANTRLELRVNDIVTNTITIPPADEMWLEMYADASDALYFLYSVDGENFLPIDDIQGGALALDDVNLVMMAGAFEPFAGVDHYVAVDDFEYCSEPFGS